MMSLIVQKFGGSSVRDAARLQRVAEIIQETRAAGNDVVAVLSAQGDTTDHLIEKARELSPSPPAREMDMLLSTGEQASAALCAIALHARGAAAVSLNGWQAGIRTDDNYDNAGIREIDAARIRRECAAGNIVLVAGFQGADACGNVTTLGRGGSDTSAVALSAALHASLCQIYTDVDGIYTTDPRICPQARHLERISCRHMLLLAQHGAQVMHGRSMEIAARSTVPIEVRSCRRGSRVTRITEEDDGLPALALSRGEKLARITAVGSGFPSVRAMQTAVEALEAAGLTVCGVEEGEEFFSLFVPPQDAEAALCVLHEVLVEA